MQASFRDLRVPGELLCGSAHDILTTRRRFCASRLGDRPTYGRGGKPVGRLREDGASRSWAETQANADVNYNRLSNRMFWSLAFAKARQQIIPHRQVIEPNVER